MRTIRIKLFKFNELSKDAKEKAIEDWRQEISGENDFAWIAEVRQTLEAFAKVFPVKIKDWSYGGRGEGVDFVMDCTFDEVAQLSGWRLATYIWNRFRNDLFSGQYYSLMHKGKYKSRKSKVFLTHSCELTGVCFDEDILEPVYKFLNKPDNRTFEELMSDCFAAWIKSANANIEHQLSDESITEILIANDYEFTKDGKRN